MASTWGQDVILCNLCPNPVEHHCNLCHVNLCPSCIPQHMADKSRRHEVVEYTSQKRHTVVPPSCSTHKNNICETYCLDCKIQTCTQCIVGSHKKHDFTEISTFLQNQKQQILNDTDELENTILPIYRNNNQATILKESENVCSAIEKQEHEITKAVHEISMKLQFEVKRLTEKSIEKKKDNGANKTVQELNEIIKKNKCILRNNDGKAMINYHSRNKDFRKGPECSKLSLPKLLPGIVQRDQILDMLGFLQIGDEESKKAEMLKVMDEPVILSTIQCQIVQKHLSRVICIGKDRILISGKDRSITLIYRTGFTLKTILTDGIVIALTVNLQQEPVFSLSSLIRKNTDVYVYSKGKVEVLISTPDWFPVGLCYTGNGDLLVSMRSVDGTQSRVVKYASRTEIQNFQNDSQGQPLFSTGVESMLLLTENGNGDICVADCAGEAVVVVDSFGKLRFKYEGKLSKQSDFKQPYHIVTDVKNQILISECTTNIIHIINSDGEFVCYLEHPCNGGLSIGTDNNIVVGDVLTGKIQILKYLE
ncbi:uncharacterized protein LOC134283161 [Saccostrea cucullata]|uniref:uncharacterized protein LOC134283161 n=1 Tax=Saccostrea cuccullata TaxID=36930 RepID=UPI002ED3858B